MYENQLEFIKPKFDNSLSEKYYSDINKNDLSNNYDKKIPQYENYVSNFNYNNNNNNDNDYNHIEHNNTSNQKFLYINEQNNIMKQTEINNEIYARNQHLDYPEQLNYMNQHNVNIFPDLKPTPLVYNGLTRNPNHNSNIKKRGKSAKNIKKSVRAKWDYNKNFLTNLKNKMKNSKKNKLTNKSNPKHNIVCFEKDCKENEQLLIRRNINFNTNIESKKNAKGLFDPNLKSNELDFPRKTVIQRLERLEKIKNYDVKFGSKVKKLEVYKNIMDMFDDLAFDSEEKNFRKKEKDLNRKGNISKDKIHNRKEFDIINYNLLEKDDTEDIIKENKSKYKTNLDFNFSHQEQMIKALEQQINQERKLRAEVNFKYLNKMKELEENKIKDFIKLTTKSLSKSASRSKSKGNKTKNNVSASKPDKLLKVYLPGYDLIKDDKQNNFENKKLEIEKNKFKNNLDNSIQTLRKHNKLIDTRSARVKSEEAMKKALEEIKPKLDKVIEEDFQKIIKKNNLLKSKSKSNTKNKLIKKLYVAKNNKRNNINNISNRKSIDKDSEISNSKYSNINYNQKEYINNSINNHNINNSMNEKFRKEYEFSNQKDNFNNSSIINELKHNQDNVYGTNQNSLSLSNVFDFLIFII